MLNNDPQTTRALERLLLGMCGLPIELLPIMDCENCQHRNAAWRDGGHCYMFREKPEGDRCGQFKAARKV